MVPVPAYTAQPGTRDLPPSPPKKYVEKKQGIGATIRIGRESQCLPYAGFLRFILKKLCSQYDIQYWWPFFSFRLKEKKHKIKIRGGVQQRGGSQQQGRWCISGVCAHFCCSHCLSTRGRNICSCVTNKIYKPKTFFRGGGGGGAREGHSTNVSSPVQEAAACSLLRDLSGAPGARSFLSCNTGTQRKTTAFIPLPGNSRLPKCGFLLTLDFIIGGEIGGWRFSLGALEGTVRYPETYPLNKYHRLSVNLRSTNPLKKFNLFFSSQTNPPQPGAVLQQRLSF